MKTIKIGAVALELDEDALFNLKCSIDAMYMKELERKLAVLDGEIEELQKLLDEKLEEHGHLCHKIHITKKGIDSISQR